MPTALVRSANGQFGGTSPKTVALGAVPTGGNLIVVALATWADTLNSFSSVTDNQTGAPNTYTRVAQIAQSTGATPFIEIWACPNITVNAGTFQVTSTFGVGTGLYGTMAVMEVSGALTSSPFDVAASARYTSGTTATSGSTATTANANSFVVGVVSGGPNPAGYQDPITGYTTIYTDQTDSEHNVSIQYKNVTSTGAQEANFGPLSASTPGTVALVAVFGGTGGGGGGGSIAAISHYHRMLRGGA